MDLNKILFSVHDYNCDGDVADIGIFLHFGEVRIKVADTLEGFRQVGSRIAGMSAEIEENYSFPEEPK